MIAEKSTQRRMLTQSEIESLQKDKKDSLEKMIKIFDEMDIKAIIAKKMAAK